MQALAVARDDLTHAIQAGISDAILTDFLRVIAACEDAVQQVVAHLPRHDEALNDGLQRLHSGGMLAYAGNVLHSDLPSLRRLLHTRRSVVAWYGVRWSQPDVEADTILAAVATSLRTPLTVLAGNTEFYFLCSEPTSAVTMPIHALHAIFALVCQSYTSVQRHLNGRGVVIPAFRACDGAQANSF